MYTMVVKVKRQKLGQDMEWWVSANVIEERHLSKGSMG